MDRSGEGVDQTVAGTVLLVLGGILAVFTGWQLFSAEIAGLVSLLVGIVPGFLLAFLLGMVGLWLLREGPTGGYARRLLAWAVASGTFGAISASLVVIYETNRGAVVYEAPLVVANTAAGFAVFGLVVGRYDVQARKRQADLSRYMQLVENVPVGIFRTTPEPEGQFVEVNPAMVDIFRADKHSGLLSRPVTDVYVDPDQRAVFSERLQSGRPVVEREVRLQRLDGEQFWASVTAIRHDEDGQTYFDGIVEDVTERKRYQQRLERDNEQLEMLNDVLRHDVRNDMAVVRARAERLRASVDGHDEDVDALLSRVDHSVGLTETARDLAKAVTAGREEGLAAVGLASTLRAQVDALRQSHDEATVTVEGDLPAVTVRANDMLSSVFRNLLQNAIQHTDRAEPRVSISVETDDDTATVHVADDGPGIPDDQKETVFEHGQKGDGSGGTGLGLYLVATLVEQYGGEVTVRDRTETDRPRFGPDDDGRGAVFSVTLRRAEGTASWYD
jgi:PAS domain S-box-containing protein